MHHIFGLRFFSSAFSIKKSVRFLLLRHNTFILTQLLCIFGIFSYLFFFSHPLLWKIYQHLFSRLDIDQQEFFMELFIESFRLELISFECHSVIINV